MVVTAVVADLTPTWIGSVDKLVGRDRVTGAEVIQQSVATNHVNRNNRRSSGVEL